MTQRVIVVLGSLAFVVLAVLLYHFDPARHGFYPRCQFHAMTGLACPGCGGLRALHALAHGQVAAAFRFNALVVVGLPLAAVAAGIGLLGKERRAGARLRLPAAWVAWGALLVVVLFGIVRNLPAVARAGLAP